jgi:hypothetical protein
VRNVYSYRANVNVRDNVRVNEHVNERVNDHFNGAPRASFRGPSGVQAQPRPSEGAAYREPYAPRMNTQVQHEQHYAAVPGQAAAQNHGRPATPAVSRPIPADHNVHPQSRQSGGGQEHHR